MTPSPSWPKPWEPSGGSVPGPVRSGRRENYERAECPATGERDALGELTPQQRQIVRLASEGLTNAQIGDRLFLSRARSARTCTGPIPSSGSPTATSYAM